MTSIKHIKAMLDVVEKEHGRTTFENARLKRSGQILAEYLRLLSQGKSAPAAMEKKIADAVTHFTRTPPTPQDTP